MREVRVHSHAKIVRQRAREVKRIWRQSLSDASSMAVTRWWETALGAPDHACAGNARTPSRAAASIAPILPSTYVRIVPPGFPQLIPR